MMKTFMTLFLCFTLLWDAKAQIFNEDEVAAYVESNLHLLKILTDIKEIDDNMLLSSTEYKKNILANYWAGNTNRIEIENTKDLHSIHGYSFYHGDSATTLLVDLAAIGVGVATYVYTSNKANPDKLSFMGFSAVLASMGSGAIKASSPSFNTSIQDKNEKAIISEAKLVIGRYCRDYAKNVAIIFELSVAEEKKLELAAFEAAMSNYYIANHHGIKEPKKFDAIVYLKENKIALKKVETFELFERNYQQYLTNTKLNDISTENQRKLKINTHDKFTNTINNINGILDSIEVREKFITDPILLKKLDELRLKTQELKDNHELTQGDHK
ncbi:MAG: hypothetical protein JNM93_05015 [Bacteriovoracaceae bacterium]|nr:hypothetical protein [Bacteriovoracaceae bacterium]